jgi:hypothetical protein
VLVAITVSPAIESLGVGQTEQFTATGTYSNLSTANLTDSVTWSSSKKATATISSQGLATGVATGVVTITATDPSADVDGTALLTVTPAVLVAVTVAPVADDIAVGQTEQFTATGTYSNLTTANVTDSVTWTSSDTATATVSAEGSATGVATGVTTITATDPTTSIPGTAVLTVGVATASLTMSPASGPRKAPVTISGEGFTPGQTVTVIYNSGRKHPKRATTVLCTAVTSTEGTFSCQGTIPKRSRAGARGAKSITATDNGDTLATTLFTLIGKSR